MTGKQTGSRAQSRHADIHIPLIIVLVPHSSFMLDCSMVDDIIEMTRAIILETSGNFSGLRRTSEFLWQFSIFSNLY